eukprot:1881287-Pleurochrysis_carterae.AAC.1
MSSAAGAPTRERLTSAARRSRSSRSRNSALPRSTDNDPSPALASRASAARPKPRALDGTPRPATTCATPRSSPRFSRARTTSTEKSSPLRAPHRPKVVAASKELAFRALPDGRRPPRSLITGSSARSAHSTASASARTWSLTSTSRSSDTHLVFYACTHQSQQLLARTQDGCGDQAPECFMLENTAAQAAPPYVGSATSRATACTPSCCAGSAASASTTSARIRGKRTAASAALRPASPASDFSAVSLH